MKNKRRIRLLSALMVMLLCTITLTGCQLAIPTTNSNVTSDKLCGVFVTIGYNNIPINDDVLKDSEVTFNSNGEITFDEIANASSSGNKIEGKKSEERNTVVFDGTTGYYMGILHELGTNGEYFNSLMCDPSLNDVKYAINATDNTEEQNGEATLFVSKKFHEVFYLNPVYLTGEGSYYTILGNAQGASFFGETSGSICSQTIDSAITQSDGNTSKTEKSSYKINLEVVDEVKKTVIKEMNQNDELIKVTEYLPNSPEEFTVESETSYVIVEEVLDGSSKVPCVIRNIYVPLSRDSIETSNQHHCNFPGENGVIAQKLIKFVYTK